MSRTDKEQPCSPGAERAATFLAHLPGKEANSAAGSECLAIARRPGTLIEGMAVYPGGFDSQGDPLVYRLLERPVSIVELLSFAGTVMVESLGRDAGENLYQHALLEELRNWECDAHKEYPVPIVFYDSSGRQTILGTYRVDVLMTLPENKRVVIELKHKAPTTANKLKTVEQVQQYTRHLGRNGVVVDEAYALFLTPPGAGLEPCHVLRIRDL